jgi:OmcA/MtrC family decaheme c-type cytochrome
MWSRHARFVWIVLLMLAVALLGGLMAITPVAAQDAPDPATPITASPAVQPETCVICHRDSGANHQASYDELNQDGIIQVTDLAYSYTAPDTTTVTFKMTKDGLPFNASKADSLAIYFAPWDGEAFQFDPAAERLSLAGDMTYDGAGGNTSTLVGEIPDLTDETGVVVLYGTDETVGQLPARVRLAKYPFAALLQMGDGVDYVSPANNAGCENCHSIPYLKHGYIYGQVNGDPATDFVTCKACHLDNGEGGHFEWQLMVDDPAAAAEFLAQGEEGELTPEQQEQYAYKTTLMNDVHMSHAMEFPYPQSMANCTTCHAGKLESVLSDENFTLETCKSCHPMNGSEEYGTAELALMTIMPPEDHDNMDWEVDACTDCHEVGKKAPGFSEIHTGYDTAIYTAAGVRYSEAVSVTIDSAAFDGSKLTFGFSAVQDPNLGLDLTTITPTVMVGLYGWDTKDYIVGAHERLFDDNGDGAIDGEDQRALEYEVGSGDHPRISTVSADGGNWEVAADLSSWADMLADGSVKRVEVAVMPALLDADGVMLAINSPSRTFDLGANAFVDDFYAPIAKVTDGCNNCHAALAVTFHEPDRGGNLVTCRMCHITKSGSSHLEMQSRSLDSYIHALHAGQVLDIADIDFTDPVQAMHYNHHIEFPFPTHGSTNCEACHVEGMYNMPDQTKSLPGILSASETLSGTVRTIGAIPSVVTGPGSRACGGCHRAELINEDAVSELIPFDIHTEQGGYMVEAGDVPTATLNSVIDQIITSFK